LLQLLPPTPASTLFPYTTLFRSVESSRGGSYSQNLLLDAAHQDRRVRAGAGVAAVGRGRGQLNESPRFSREPRAPRVERPTGFRSEEHTSELQSRGHLVCRLLLE